METRKLSLNEMEMVEGGSSNMWDCLAMSVSGVGVIMAFAMASNPIGWLALGIGGISFGIGFFRNPYACEN